VKSFATFFRSKYLGAAIECVVARKESLSFRPHHVLLKQGIRVVCSFFASIERTGLTVLLVFVAQTILSFFHHHHTAVLLNYRGATFLPWSPTCKPMSH
jgi:hypothetical protein